MRNNNLWILLQTINFFTLGPKLCLVDLPGYGFAYAKEEVKEAWEEFVSILFYHIFHEKCLKHHIPFLAVLDCLIFHENNFHGTTWFSSIFSFPINSKSTSP